VKPRGEDEERVGTAPFLHAVFSSFMCRKKGGGVEAGLLTEQSEERLGGGSRGGANRVTGASFALSRGGAPRNIKKTKKAHEILVKMEIILIRSDSACQ